MRVNGNQRNIGSDLAERDDFSTTAVIDARGTITSWSQGAQQLLGYEPADVVGKPAASLLAGKLPDATLGSLAELPRWSGKVQLSRRDGSQIEIGLIAHHRPADSGKGAEWFVVVPFRGDDGPEYDAALVERGFDQGPCATAIYDSTQRLRRANEYMERALGLTEAEMRGLRISEILLHPHFEETDSAIRHVLTTGEQLHRENFFRTPGAERKQAWAVSIAPIKDSHDQVSAVCLSAHDETQQYWARRRLLLLNEASAHIGSTLDIARTAQELADVAVHGLSDIVSVEMLSSLDYEEEPSSGVAAGPVVLRHLAHAAALDDYSQVLPREGAVETYPHNSPHARCLALGHTVQVSRAELGSDAVIDESADNDAGRIGFHTMAVPMRARGLTLGVALFVRHRAAEAFDADDVLLAEEITARAAVCIDNARRYTRERTTALALQRNLLPQRLPQQSAVEVASRYLPAGVRAGIGGDWFDVIPLPGARVALVVGDVVGHGLQASATMGRLRGAVRTLAGMDLPPDELLTHLDDLVTRLAEEAHDPGAPPGRLSGDIGATCLYAIYDPVSQNCAIARAGHPPPAIVTTDGVVELLDLPANPPLGMGGQPFESAEIRLSPGSLMALFTDGLIEAHGRDIEQGFTVLRDTLARPGLSPEDACDSLLAALVHDRPQDDDIALLVARPRALGREQVATWEIPADPAAVAVARKAASGQLATWGLPEAIFATELVVSELITNAIRHAMAPIQLRLIHDRSLICEVSDASNTAPHLRRAHIYDEDGRGLMLVAQLTQSWGTRQGSAGKTIWAEQTLPSKL